MPQKTSQKPIQIFCSHLFCLLLAGLLTYGSVPLWRSVRSYLRHYFECTAQINDNNQKWRFTKSGR